MFSIDQNCHSLWDTPPKLQALARKGHRVRQLVEDIDVAFTAIGADMDRADLRIAQERYHHGGGADWGAALFYSEFLGRLPADIRRWEPFTGIKTSVLARRLGRSVQDLFDEFSPGDNWQLIGSSYVADRRHHRVIGDLTVAETAGFLRRIMDKAREDMLGAFGGQDAGRRLRRWFAREREQLERRLAERADGRLVDLYLDWLAEYVGGSADLDLTSTVFACRPDSGRTELLDLFLKDYDLAAGLYNEAIAETDTGIHPLKTAEGELPFFAAMDYHGHFVRAGVFLRGGELLIGEDSFRLAAGNRAPMPEMADAGVRCLAGKAVILVNQVRTGKNAQPLALPYGGSLYMPAANRLAEKLLAHRLIDARLAPIVRVRFHLLDRMGAVQTPIRPPGYLREVMGREEVPASDLAAEWPDIAAHAAAQLELSKTPLGRQRWQNENFPDLMARLDELDRRRRQLARTNPAPEDIRPLSQQARSLRTELLDNTLRRIARDVHLSQMDYWDSRGAMLPWSIALGGEKFYNDLIEQAEIYQEPPLSPRR